MPDTVTLEFSQHICRVVSTAVGAVLVSVCFLILLVQSCRWINKALDNRQYRLETDRKERLEKARHETIAEREGWRQHDEYLVAALAGYAKENYQYRKFLAQTKVADVFTKWQANEEENDDAHA